VAQLLAIYQQDAIPKDKRRCSNNNSTLKRVLGWGFHSATQVTIHKNDVNLFNLFKARQDQIRSPRIFRSPLRMTIFIIVIHRIDALLNNIWRHLRHFHLGGDSQNPAVTTELHQALRRIYLTHIPREVVGQPSKVRIPLLNLTNLEDVLNSPGTNYAGPGVAWRTEWSPETPLQFGPYQMSGSNMPQPPVQDVGPETTSTTPPNPGANNPANENQERQSATPEGEVHDPLVRFWRLEEQ
jgi:hypothetical protein